MSKGSTATAQENLPDLPMGWTSLPVKDAVSKIPLTGKKLMQREYQETGTIPVVDQGMSLIGGYTDRADLRIHSDSPLVVFGDHTKAVKFVDFAFVAGADGIRVLDPCRAFDPKLFYYFVQAVSLPSKGYARHYQFLDKALIPLPPLAEQHRIVAKIEELFTQLDAGVDSLKRAQVLLKRYRQSVLRDALTGKLTEKWRLGPGRLESQPAGTLLEEARQLQAGKLLSRLKMTEIDIPPLLALPDGWEWARLGEICEIKGGITKNKARVVSNGREVLYLRVANVQRGYLDLANVTRIMADEGTIEALCLYPGDILFTEGGDRDKLGRGWVWQGEIAECIHQNHIFRARPLVPGLVPELISWYGNAFGQRYFMTEGVQTTNLASVSMTKLRSFPVPIPPASEQQEIKKRVVECLSVIDHVSAEIARMEQVSSALRQSILRQAFSGKLVLQDPTDEPASRLLERIREEKAESPARKKHSRRTKPNEKHTQMRLIQDGE